MAIAFVASSSGTASSTTSPTTVTLPTGYNAAGNITIIGAANGNGAIMSAPAGWTVVYSTAAGILFYRFYQAGDPATITLSWVGLTEPNWGCVTYSGVDAAKILYMNQCIIPTTSIAMNQNPVVVRAPSVKPVYTNGQLVVFYSLGHMGTPTLTIEAA